MNSAPSDIPVHLADVLDAPAAGPLLESLLAVRGADAAVDAAAVTRASTPCLQVLLAAAKTWAAEGHAFRIVNPSAAFVEAYSLLGLTSDQLFMEHATS